jgi:kumamolisin
MEQAKRNAVKLAVKQCLAPSSGKYAAKKPAAAPKPELKFEDHYAVGNQNIDRIVAFAKANGFKVVEKNELGRFVILSGKLGELGKAFGIETCMVEAEGIRYRSHRGKVQPPEEIRDAVDAVLGFDTRPVGQRHAQADHGRPVDPRKVAALYDFPKTLTGSGQCIGIVELGGGFRAEDIRKYFHSYGRSAPQIEVRELIGPADAIGGTGTNAPAPPADVKKFWDALVSGKITKNNAGTILGSIAALQRVFWTIETTMDIELIGTLAGGAKIVVYFAPNTEQGKFHAWTAALTDQVNRPSVISGSFGMLESQLEPHAIRTLNDLYHDAVLRGVTICCSQAIPETAQKMMTDRLR